MSMAKLRSPLVARKKSPPLGLIRSCSGWFLLWLWLGASGVRPGPDPFLRAEIVRCSGRTRVTRLFLPGRAVIRKEPLGPDAERRVRNEAAMLENLRGVAGVAQLAQAPRYPGSVVLADAGEVSLAGLARPLPADELAGLGLGLARSATP